jgi:hypothetical protein
MGVTMHSHVEEPREDCDRDFDRGVQDFLLGKKILRVQDIAEGDTMITQTLSPGRITEVYLC